MKKEIKLGDTVCDTITGFAGVVICVSKWLHGCSRITIQPREMDANGKIKEQHTFDLPQLKLIDTKKKEKKSSKTGGWSPEPEQAIIPNRF